MDITRLIALLDSIRNVSCPILFLELRMLIISLIFPTSIRIFSE